MATEEHRIVGLKATRAGDPLATGATAEGIKEFQEINPPYNGGITVTGTVPTDTKFFDEGRKNPFFSLRDASTGGTEITWSVANFDTSTREFYFGSNDAELYEGEKAFAFDANTGETLIFARLKYVATLSGGINKSDPLQISVSATMLAPTTSGRAWDVVKTPTYTSPASPANVSTTSSGSSKSGI